MSVRSFTVFQDTPTEIQKISHVSDKNLVTTTAADAAATLLSTLAAIEKENLHPLTGERAAQTTTNASKKRKTAVLVTKVVVPPPSSKKQKELKSDSKKLRKSASGNVNRSDGRKKFLEGHALYARLPLCRELTKNKSFQVQLQVSEFPLVSLFPRPR